MGLGKGQFNYGAQIKMNKNKSFSEKMSDSYKSLIAWYAGLGTWGRILIASLIIAIMGIFIIIMIPTLKVEKAGGLPSLLEQKPGLPSLIYPLQLPSLLTHVKKTEPTIEGILCKMMYDHDMMNITLGSTTCYPYKEFGYDCVCIQPLS